MFPGYSVLKHSKPWASIIILASTTLFRSDQIKNLEEIKASRITHAEWFHHGNQDLERPALQEGNITREKPHINKSHSHTCCTAKHLPLKTIIGRYQLRGQSLFSAAVKNHFILINCSSSCISINALVIDISIYTPTWHETTRWSQKGEEVRIN